MKERLLKLNALFGRDDKMRLIKLFFLMVVGSILDVAGVGAIPAFVGTLAMPDKIMAHPKVIPILAFLDITTVRELVLWSAGALIVVYILKNAFLVIVSWVQVKTTERYKVSLTLRLFTAYMRAPYEFHLNRNSSELLRNLTMETNTVVTGIINQILSLLMAILMTSLIVGLLLVVTPGVALVTVAIVGSGAWAFLRIVRGRVRYYGKVAQREKRKSIQTINQSLGSIVESRIRGTTDYFVQRYHRSDKRWANARRHQRFINMASKPILEAICVVGILGIMIGVVLLGADVVTLVPTLALLGASVVRLRVTLTQIVNGVSSFRFSMVAIDPIYDDLKELTGGRVRAIPQLEKPEVDRSGEEFVFNDRIELRNATYSYPDTSKPVLDDINLSIKRGAAIGFVGSTGSGKTTLINTILGLLEPQQGEVLVDGQDIQSNISGWRRHVGYIPQVIFLLDDTIRRNVAFGIPDNQIDDNKVWEALRAAQLASFVQDLDQGLESQVGESGVRISGGQRQRIGLARALYNNPQVLIMDEATSSLDNETENLVMQALNSLREDRTFIMIAHRLSTVKDCDTLYFLRDGRVAGSGTFEELSESDSAFRHLAQVAS